MSRPYCCLRVYCMRRLLLDEYDRMRGETLVRSEQTDMGRLMTDNPTARARNDDLSRFRTKRVDRVVDRRKTATRACKRQMRGV